jgi:phosphatidyl-myo-inositol dimannoside synthase
VFQAEADRVQVLLSEIYPPRPGGSGRWLSEIYHRLSGPKCVVTDEIRDSYDQYSDAGGIASRDPGYVKRIDLRLKDTGMMSCKGGLGYLRVLGDVRSIFKGDQVKLGQAARVVPEGWVLWLWRSFFRGPPFELFAHGEEVNLDGVKTGGVMSSRQHQLMARVVFRSAQRVIANSHNTAELLIHQWGIPAEKVVVLHPGVDTEFFRPSAKDIAIGESLGWKNRYVLLTVGRLQRRKGHDRVIEALPQLIESIPDLLYVIAGDGEEYKRLEALVESLSVQPYVQFLRAFDDTKLLHMYQHCDLFVLANRTIGADIEGFGMVLVEAAACGKPTVAGSSGGTKEAIVDGVTGLLIDADAVDELVKAVKALHDDPELCKRLGSSGRRRAETEFSWSVALSPLLSR